VLFRAISLIGAAVCVLPVISSLHHLVLVAARAGLLASHWADWLLGPMAAIQATLPSWSESLPWYRLAGAGIA
jgi:hypothetical protein